MILKKSQKLYWGHILSLLSAEQTQRGRFCVLLPMEIWCDNPFLVQRAADLGTGLLSAQSQEQIVSPRNYPVSHLTGTTTRVRGEPQVLLPIFSGKQAWAKTSEGKTGRNEDIVWFLSTASSFYSLFSNKCFVAISTVLGGATWMLLQPRYLLEEQK